MAWLEEHPTSGHFKICFRWDGRKQKKTIKTQSRKEAEGVLLRFQENIALIERGRLEVPLNADIGTFLLSDGKLTQKAKSAPARAVLTLAELSDRYVQTHSHGAMEQNSLDTVKMHLRHFVASFRGDYPVQTLALTQLQEHVDRRAKKKGVHQRPLSPVTLRKEVASLRACWNRGVAGQLLTGPFPRCVQAAIPRQTPRT